MAYIMTHDPIRRTRWLNLFGTDQLPVFSDTPRWQPVWECGETRVVPAYDLDLRALGETAVNRYAAWIAGRNQRDYEEARAELMGTVSVPIKATSCEVVTVEERRPSPLFVWWIVRIVRQRLGAKRAPDVGICWK